MTRKQKEEEKKHF